MSKKINKLKKEIASIDFDALKKAGINRTREEFYILGNYPPLAAMDDCCEEDLLKNNSQKELDIYIHFQFCNQLCYFCHFYMDQRAKGAQDIKVLTYLKYLKAEISLLAKKLGKITARSVHVGGGTPSFMSPEQIKDLFSHLRKKFNIPKNITITFETHPSLAFDPLCDEKIKAMKISGVNRVSIGGVDLNDEVLRFQNRGHKASHTLELIKKYRAAGFPHVVTDLMLGVPHQTPENWEKTLNILTEKETKVDCVMTFPLMFKATQPLWRIYQQKQELFPTVKDRMLLQLLTLDICKNKGYKQGPVYYFNKEEKHQNDQQLRKFEYIEDTGLLAIGVSSFGFINGHQYFNTTNIKEYYAAIESGRLPIWKSARLTKRNKFERAIMFGLKSRGINIFDLEKKYGFNINKEYGPLLSKLQNAGVITIRKDYIFLSRLGLLFAEEICDQFAGKDIRIKAETNAKLFDPTSPTQRHNYNMIGHKLKPSPPTPITFK